MHCYKCKEWSCGRKKTKIFEVLHADLKHGRWLCMDKRVASQRGSRWLSRWLSSGAGERAWAKARVNIGYVPVRTQPAARAAVSPVPSRRKNPNENRKLCFSSLLSLNNNATQLRVWKSPSNKTKMQDLSIERGKLDILKTNSFRYT